MARERLQREAALGKRVSLAQDGSLGPVIKRWINASLGPVSLRLRLAASFYLASDYPAFCSVLDSPIFELQTAMEEGAGERSSLNAILYWFTKAEARNADDMILAALGTAISSLATAGLSHTAERGRKRHAAKGVFLTGCLSSMGDASRETALGQFLTQVQGAEAMERVRRKDRSSWAQRDKMDAVAALLFGQVLPQLLSEDRGEVTLDKIGTRSVVKVLRQTEDGPIERMLTLRKPDKQDWELLEVARRTKGEADPYKQAWMTFALLVLCAAQAEHGWFDLGKERKSPTSKSRNGRWKVWALHLAEEPTRAMGGDLAKWLHMGFVHDPMLTEPDKGDYLSVKHKSVVGRRGPMGLHTEAEGTFAWEMACDVMGTTAWQVAGGTLAEINRGPLWEAALKSTGGDEDTLKNVLGAYAREAGEEAIYMPLYMDFRGRVYPRTTWVTYQGTDVQKGLLKFPCAGVGTIQPPPDAYVMHMANLYGNGLDKSTLSRRDQWWEDMRGTVLNEAVTKAEEPIQFYTASRLGAMGLYDAVPCQIDGTCNGLQHLSALFRDELAAPFVNLTASSYEEHPADLYGEAAERVLDMMTRKVGSYEIGCEAEIDHNWKWISRSVGNYKIDRKLLKKPLMVLPYGGTFNAIEEAVIEAVLAQEPDATIWQNCLVRVPFQGLIEDPESIQKGYLAFKDRPLREHPLFHDDMKKLSLFVLEAIKKVIPRAMAAMDSFRAIAKGVGERSLEWSTGLGGETALWVVHAYPMAARSSLSLRGFHLPNSIRGLSLQNGKDEVDPRAHRTGIVANFIHSQDASHLARTMFNFRARRGTSFAAIHDCYIARASEMPTLNTATRVSFCGQYLSDPLKQPVRLRDLKTGKVEEFLDWFALAKVLGVTFPDYGKWDPAEVLESAWFFS